MVISTQTPPQERAQGSGARRDQYQGVVWLVRPCIDPSSAIVDRLARDDGREGPPVRHGRTAGEFGGTDESSLSEGALNEHARRGPQARDGGQEYRRLNLARTVPL